MGRFQSNQNFELPLFSVFTVVPLNHCVHSCNSFVAITISSASCWVSRGLGSSTRNVDSERKGGPLWRRRPTMGWKLSKLKG